MRYWDTSAIVPMLLAERRTSRIQAEFENDPEIVTWWATVLECLSAISRRAREEDLDRTAISEVGRRLTGLASGWQEIEPQAAVRETAKRLLRVHPLRAGDALQLAAAIAAAEGNPATLQFITLDDRQALAAELEGFVVLVP